jgi:AraC-like DNA-binding protein
MLRYVIETAALNEMLARLHRLFDIRITFFDLEGRELDYFDIKEMSPFCRRLRRSVARDRDCVACDRTNLEIAKGQRGMHLYRCHVGLMEGIVPLYDRRGIYLGAVVFGQLRPTGARPPASCSGRLAELYRALPAAAPQRMEDIARVLACVTEHIVRSEMVRLRNRSWAEELERYISEHLGERITVRDMARVIRRSPSFVSHHFPEEFGASPASYVLRRRMEAAEDLLREGAYVYRVAEKLGFYDAFHFSKSFKAYYGVSPVEWRGRD